MSAWLQKHADHAPPAWNAYWFAQHGYVDPEWREEILLVRDFVEDRMDVLATQRVAKGWLKAK